MKKNILFAFSLVTYMICVVSASAQTATEYNDYIVDEQNKIGEKMISFSEQLSSEIPDEKLMRNNHTALVNQINESLKKVKSISPFKGETEFRDAAISLFEFYLNCVENGYKELMFIAIRAEYTDEEMIRINEIINQITEEELKHDERFTNAQMDFSIKYDFELIDNELQEVIDE